MLRLLTVGIILTVVQFHKCGAARRIETYHIVNSTQNPPVATFSDERRVVARPRTNIVLTCPINCEPSCIFHWTKNTETISTWERFDFLSPSNSHLQIRSLKPEDAGAYECLGVNGFGSTQAKFNIVVEGDEPSETNLIRRTGPTEWSKPQILTESLPSEESVTVSRGQNLFLHCEAKGLPLPRVTWLKNNLCLLESSDNVSQLRLTNVTAKDAATYTCQAQNEHGKASYELRVKVTGGDDVYGGAAELLSISPTNLTLVPGQSGSINCLVYLEESYSKPLLFWVKRLLAPPAPPPPHQPNSNSNPPGVAENLFVHEGNLLQIVDRPEVIQKSSNTYSTTLVLRNVTRATAGTYVCVLAGPTRTGDFSFLEAQVFVSFDITQTQEMRRKTAQVQWTLLWTFCFLFLAILTIICFSRLYKCRQNRKKIIPVFRTRPNPIGSSFRVAVPTKSPGETVSTTLTHHNEVCHPFLQRSSGVSSGSFGSSSIRSGNWSAGVMTTPSRKRTYRQRRTAERTALNGSSTVSDSDSCFDSGSSGCRAPFPSSRSNYFLKISGGNDANGVCALRLHRIPISKTKRTPTNLEFTPVAPIA